MKKKGNLYIQNRKKGHHAERFYVTLFKELGYDKCITSRLGSRICDNAGIDLVNIPYNIQIKAGKQTNMRPSKVLFNMEMQVKALFPENDARLTYPYLLIHRPKSFSESIDKDILWISENLFNEFKEKIPEIEYMEKKEREFAMKSQFHTIVKIHFSKIKNLLKNDKR